MEIIIKKFRVDKVIKGVGCILYEVCVFYVRVYDFEVIICF